MRVADIIYPLWGQWFALGCFALFVGFTFCDGFRLAIGKKLVWFVFFAGLSALVLHFRGEYDLAIILPYSSLLAFGLCFWERRKDLWKHGGRRLRPFRRL